MDNNLIEELPQKLFTNCAMLATFSIHMMVWLVWFSLLYIFGSTWLEKDLNK